MKSFNLLPWRDIKRESRLIKLTYVFSIIAILLSMFVIMMSVIIINKTHAAKIALEVMSIKLKSQEKTIENINASNNEIGIKSHLLLQFKKNKGHQVEMLDALEKISLVMEGKIILQEIHCEDNNFKLMGEIRSKNNLNEVIKELKASNIFADVKIDKLLEKNEDVKIWISFLLKK